MKYIIQMSLAIFCLMLSACQSSAVPVEQIEQQVQQQTEQEKITEQPKKETVKRSVVARPKWVEYRCNKNKVVQVQPRNVGKGNKKTIAVSYNGTQHTLSAGVTRNGKKYSNIRWIWWEKFNGTAELTDNSGKVLATNCKKGVAKR